MGLMMRGSVAFILNQNENYFTSKKVHPYQVTWMECGRQI